MSKKKAQQAFKLMKPSEPDVERYSPLIRSLYYTFQHYKKSGCWALLVYRNEWEGKTDFVGVKPGQYAWSLHDRYIEALQIENISQLIVAFDLNKPFEEQIPAHFLNTMAGFAALLSKPPLVWIEDRTGVISAEENERFYDRIRRGNIKLTVDNTPRSAEPD